MDTKKAYSGTYGNNGFQLKFGTDTAFGDDTSGNNNDFTSSVLVASDSVTIHTHKYICISRGKKGKRQNNARGNFKEINTQFDPTDSWSTTNFHMTSTMEIPKDKKIYFEFLNDDSGYDDAYYAVGVGAVTAGPSSTNVGGGRTITVYNRSVYVNGTATDYGGTAGLGGLASQNRRATKLQTGDILGVAIDGATRKVWFSWNGVFFKSPSTNNSGTTGNPAGGTYEIGTVDLIYLWC